MRWSHPSLEGRAPEFSVDATRVLKGSVVIAWRRGGSVLSPAGDVIGVAASSAEAMLMAIRHLEAPRF